ncbi:MAG: hypothetical protein QF645_13370, partial [Planctomycetota bacterium]|nr:hypothetical protein [Planctomycetota bacterium]
MLILLGLLCLQAASGIEKAEILTGGAFRPGHWAPLEVEVRSAEAMEGDLVVRTDFGFSVVHPVQLSVGGNRFLLPAIALSLDAPLQIEFRKGGATLFQYERARFGRGLYQSELLIQAEGNSPDAHTVVFDWIPKPPRLHWYEAVDAVVGSAPTGYEDMGGILSTDVADAVSRARERGKFNSRWFEPIDPAVYQLVPADGWVIGQRDFLIWFLVLYLFFSMIILGGLSLWRSRWIRFAVVLLPGVACFVVWGGFPGGSVIVVRQGCDL